MFVHIYAEKRPSDADDDRSMLDSSLSGREGVLGMADFSLIGQKKSGKKAGTRLWFAPGTAIIKSSRTLTKAESDALARAQAAATTTGGVTGTPEPEVEDRTDRGQSYVVTTEDVETLDVPIVKKSNQARLDQVVLRVDDLSEDAAISLVPGSLLGKSKVTVANRAGAALIPNRAIPLYDLITTNRKITVIDRRPQAPFNLRSAIYSLTSRVGDSPLSSLGVEPAFGFRVIRSGTVQQNVELAFLCNLTGGLPAISLPKEADVKRNVSFRITYLQGTPKLEGNFKIGLYDSTGRKVVVVSDNFTGSAGQRVVQIVKTALLESIPPGQYFLYWNVGRTAGSARFPSGLTFPLSNTRIAPPFPNTLLDRAREATAPDALNGLNDAFDGAGATYGANVFVPSIGIEFL